MSIPSAGASCLGRLIGKLAFQAKRCLRKPGADEVHDVRVSIRRLRQALRVFKPWLPEKPPRKGRRRLKAVLKTAGAVRDYDIALEWLDSTGAELPDETRTALAAAREAAAEKLLHELGQLMDSEFSAKWRKRLELDSADRNSSDAMVKLAREVLPVLATQFIESGATLAQHPKSAGKLHAFRLSAKRLRYSLEPFASVYGDVLEPKLKVLRKVQDVLGKSSDAVATRKLLPDDGVSQEIVKLLQEEEAARLAEFQTLWPRLFGNGAVEKWSRFLEGGESGREQGAESNGTPKSSRRAAVEDRKAVKRAPAKATVSKAAAETPRKSRKPRQ